MKRLFCLVILVLFLFGCGKNEGLDRAMKLRTQLLQGSGCSFDVVITADYGQKQYIFSEKCDGSENGDLSFTVIEPESISGITGRVDVAGGKLTFDEHVLAFPLLADGLLTPVSAPWFFLHALRSGYINACEDTSETMKIILHDTYGETEIVVDVFCNSDNMPYYSEIYWNGSRIVALEIDNFEIL